MNEEILYPAALIILGILVGTAVIIFLTRTSNYLSKFFQFYPESKGILKISLRGISWFVGIVIFLLFLRLALRMIGLDFTTQFIEQFLSILPRYVTAIIIVLSGAYISRLIRERTKTDNFKFKQHLLLIMDFIVNMTFILTALLHIGMDITVFLELYKVILSVLGLILAFIVGIPAGFILYHKLCKRGGSRKK